MDATPSTLRPRLTFGEKLLREVKRLLVLALLFAVALLAIKHYGFDRLNEEIRLRAEQMLRKHYVGLDISVKSARRIEGKGVELRGITISEGALQGETGSLLLSVDEIFATCDTHLPDFVTKPPVITQFDLHRVRIRAERKPNGFWGISNLLPLPTTDGPRAKVTVSDAEIEVIDARQARTGTLSLRQLELALIPDELMASPTPIGTHLPNCMHVTGKFSGDHVQSVNIRGEVDPQSGQFQMQGEVSGLEFNPRLRATLPREISEFIEPLSSVQGRSHFTFNIAREGTEKSEPRLTFAVDGEISEGRVDDGRLPDPLTDVEGKIHCDQDGLTIESMSARCGGATIGMSAQLTGFSDSSPMAIHIDARHLNLDRFPVTSLPVSARSIWEKFSPRGEVSVNAHLTYDGATWQPAVKVLCTDLSIKYDKLPYRVSEGTGEIEWRDNVVDARLRFMAESQEITCWVKINNPGPQYTGKIEVKSEGHLQVEESLLAALDTKGQRVIRAFHPKGEFSFYGRIWKDQPDALEHRKLKLDFHEMSINHDRFRYPIDKLTGSAQMMDGHWVFTDLRGRNDTADLSGTGRWDPNAADGNMLDLSISGTDIPIEEELRLALTPSMQQLWTNLRPRGSLDKVKVRLTYNPTEQSTGIEIDATQDNVPQGGSLSIEPVWFRYRLEDLTGNFHYRDGILEMRDLKGVHGASAVSAAGFCSIKPQGGWRLDLTQVNADRVILDNDLIAALPEGLSGALVKLGLVDPVNLSGRFGVQMSGEQNSPAVMDWNVKLDMDNGRLMLGMPVEHIFGQLALFGESDSRNIYCRGELQAESAMVRDMQLQHIRGPIWIDNKRLLLGSSAWVKNDVADPTPRQMEAYMFGGHVTLDGEVLFDEEGHFEVHPKMEHGDLQTIMRDLAPKQTGLKGKVFGTIDLSGTSAGMHTWRGNGKVRLVDADIYELPAIVSLLKILSIQRTERSAFSACNMNFNIEGEDLAFTTFDLSGNTIDLKGNGRVSRHRELDLRFYTQFAREDRQIPLIRPWIGEAGRQFMVVYVNGNLEEPQFNKQVFPRLNERMQALFPELARANEAGSLAPTIGSSEGSAENGGGAPSAAPSASGAAPKTPPTPKRTWIPWNR